VLGSTPFNISFRRNLVGANLLAWHRIVASVQDLHLVDQKDAFVWGLNASGIFTVKSMYAALINNEVRVSQDIWQTKLPIKIKIFLWYLKKEVVLTKDNLVTRNWSGDRGCCFCHFPETINHLFFDCFYAKFLWRAVHIIFGLPPPTNINDLFLRWTKLGTKKYNSLLLTAAVSLCWAIWITRNEVVFDRCRPKSFLQVLFRGTHWLRQWAHLQRHDDQREQLNLVGQVLETSALYFFSSNGWLSSSYIGHA